MSVNRGDVVLVDYPFTTGGAKVRPALVVQNDRDNARITNTIATIIQGNDLRSLGRGCNSRRLHFF
jgi:mRNA-degrading endonuclease toxin of MazEF toxin-antitoxin module